MTPRRQIPQAAGPAVPHLPRLAVLAAAGLAALAANVSANPCASPQPIHPVRVSFSSLSHVSRLVGFAEFTDPSNPPIFYLRSQPTGQITGSGIEYHPNFSHTAACTAVQHDLAGNVSPGAWTLSGDEAGGGHYTTAQFSVFQTFQSGLGAQGMVLVGGAASRRVLTYHDARHIVGVGWTKYYNSVSGAITFTLEEPDTIQQAFDNAVARGFAPPQEGCSPSAWLNQQSGRNVSGQTARYTATFADLCPGAYQVIASFDRTPLNQPGATPARIIESSRITVPADGRHVFIHSDDIPAVTGFITTFVGVKAVPAAVCAGQPPGTATYQLDSINCSFSLGQTGANRAPASIILHADAITPALLTPAALTCADDQHAVEVIRDDHRTPRQVRTPQALADILPGATPDHCTLSIYADADVADRGDHDGDPLTPDTWRPAPGAQPIVTFRFSDPGLDMPALRIEETRGGHTRTVIYRRHITGNAWSLDEGDGRRVHRIARADAGSLAVETRTTHNADGSVAAEYIEKFRTFNAVGQPFRRLAERIDNPAGVDGEPRTTVYSHYTDPLADGAAYGLVRQVVGPAGDWRRYVLDPASGELVEEITGYLNNAAPDPLADPVTFRAANRSTLHTRSSIADRDGDGLPEHLVTRTMAITGKPVAREHDVHWSNRTGPEGGRLRTVSFIRCVDASASWDDPANLVTLVRYHDDGPFAGRACLRNHPDGTATWNQYVEQPDGALLSTTSEGVHDDSLQPAALLDGTRVETLHNAAGALVRREVFAVTPAGELLVDAAYGGDFDAFGRPHIMLYPDGSHTETAYACCGPSRTIDRAGNQTLYTYDDLGRLESRLDYAGSAWPELTRHVLDGAGRVIETWRGPDQDSLQLISQAAYNPAGEQTWRRERWLDDDPTPARQTTFSSVQDDAGFVTTTTTLAGGATIVERVWRDGTPRETTGTAVHGTRTSHGLTPAGAGWLRTVTETLLDAAGEPTAEFTRQVIDGAGRLLRLERPAADDPANIAVTAYYHDSAGRLCREVDPDGIVTLHTYDARGQHETTAIDTDRNDRIDYAGADRIQRRRVGYASRQHNGATLAVRRNTIESWEEAGSAAPTLVARDDVALAVPLAWQARHGLETRVEIATDRATASTVTQEFHPDGTRTETTVAAGLRTGERLFDCDGNLLSAMTFAYDTRRLRVAAIDDQGRASWHSHYSDGRLKSVTTADPDPAAGGPGEDPLTTTFSHGLAADGGQITVTSSAGRPDLVERYLPTGELALRHGGDAVPERCQYDHAGRLLALTTYTSFDPAAPEQGGTTTTWQYNAAGLPVAKTFADGKGPRQGYTAAGRLRERILAREHPDGGALSLLFRYDFDDADSASHAGDIVSVTYDDPSAWPAISYACRRDGSTSSVTDAAGRRRFSHAAGRVQAEQYETGPLAGFRVARTSDAAGRLSATILSHSGTVIHEVACAYTDGDGMPRGRLQAVSAGGLHWRYTFADGAGPVARVDFLDASGTPLLTHAISHDQLDRPRALELRPPGGATLLARAWRHDAAGRLHSDTDTSGRYWQFEYDMGGRLAVARRHASDGATLPGYAREYAWDASGNRTTSTVDGRTSLWQADPAGLNQLAARTVPRAVDIHGRVAAGAGITVELDDQAAIRTGDVFHAAVDCAPAGCTYPDDSDPPRRMYVGVEAARADGARARAGGFAELPPHPQHFLHDADGNLTDDGLWRYHWDAENRLVMQERTPAAVAAGMPPERICHAYDSNGRRFERADWIRNDAEGTYAVRAVRHFLYDGWHLLYERIWQETTACAFDFRSLPVEQDAGAQPVAYASDGRDLLLPADAALIWRQLNIHAQSVLAFDLDVTDGTALLAVGVRDTTGSDRCFVLGGDWDERAGAVADFSYWRDDLPAGWRHYRIPLGQHLPTGAVLGVRVLTGAPVRLRDMRLLGPAEATETTYVWGLDVSGTLGGAGGIGGLLAIEDRGSGRIFLPCADAAGNVLALVDRASRAVVAEYAYDPFGVPLRRTGPDADACPIGFASRYTDAPTGLVNFGYRYYHPALSRWLNRDPLGEAGGANLYAFAGNAPGNRLDPLGLTDFYVFSGIRASRNTPATNYLQILAHQVRLPPPANASYTNQDQLNAAVSGHPSRSDLIAFPQLMLPNSGLKLDSEARAKAAQQFNRGAFCTGSAPRRIHIIMLGPKTIQGNPSSGCCQVSIDTLYDPGDMVWNGAPQRGYTRNWAAIANGGTASAVRLHGANRHGLPPDLGDLQPLHQVTYMAASGSRRDILAPRTFWEPDPARPPLNITDITRRALQGGQYDIVALCHSQGCNIALHTFARACCAD